MAGLLQRMYGWRSWLAARLPVTLTLKAGSSCQSCALWNVGAAARGSSSMGGSISTDVQLSRHVTTCGARAVHMAQRLHE
jgi:hypothetical protein